MGIRQYHPQNAYLICCKKRNKKAGCNPAFILSNIKHYNLNPMVRSTLLICWRSCAPEYAAGSSSR
jgi:hypothetical protein